MRDLTTKKMDKDKDEEKEKDKTRPKVKTEARYLPLSLLPPLFVVCPSCVERVGESGREWEIFTFRYLSRDALLVIHIPLLHLSFYLIIPQRNDTSLFGKVRSPLRELR